LLISRKMRNSRTTNIRRYETEKLIKKATVNAPKSTLLNSDKKREVMIAIQTASKRANPREL